MNDDMSKAPVKRETGESGSPQMLTLEEIFGESANATTAAVDEATLQQLLPRRKRKHSLKLVQARIISVSDQCDQCDRSDAQQINVYFLQSRPCSPAPRRTSSTARWR